jgi:hypothetical protein
MEHWWQWALSIMGSSAVAAALVGIAAFLGRAQLSHWLAKDLETIKAQHQRDLEAYKVSLIAETERAKATQDIKKASALMVAEKEFAALNELHLASQGNAKFIIGYWQDLARTPTPMDFAAMHARCHRLEQAIHASLIFLPDDKDRTKLRVYNSRLARLVKDCESPGRIVSGPEASDRSKEVLSVEAAIALLVNLALQRLRSME